MKRPHVLLNGNLTQTYKISGTALGYYSFVCHNYSLPVDKQDTLNG